MDERILNVIEDNKPPGAEVGPLREPSTPQRLEPETTVPIISPEEWEMAERYAASNLVPKMYQGRPADIVIAALWGRELGLGMLQALKGIGIINGNPDIYGDTALAIVCGRNDFEDIDESGDAQHAVCTVKRRGRSPVTRTFTIEQADRAGLAGKDNWKKYPERMLQMRARAYALRDTYPDVLKGLDIHEALQDDGANVTDGNQSGESRLPPAASAVAPPESKSESLAKQLSAPAEPENVTPADTPVPAEASAAPNAAEAASSDRQESSPDQRYDMFVRLLDGCKTAADLESLVGQAESLRAELSREKKSALTKAFNNKAAEIDGQASAPE